MVSQLLVHLLDGSTQGCARETEWSPFTHDGEQLEWCEATSADVARIIAVRLRGEPSPVLGASVKNEAALTVRDAQAVIASHGGAEALRPPPSMAPLRRMSERPKEQPWFRSLATMGFIDDKGITRFMAQMFRVPTIDLDQYEVELEIVMLLTKEQCEEHHVVPVSKAGGSLVVAMADPANIRAIDDLKAITGLAIEPVIASDEAIRIAITRYYG